MSLSMVVDHFRLSCLRTMWGQAATVVRTFNASDGRGRWISMSSAAIR